MIVKDEPRTLHICWDIVMTGVESKYFLEDYIGLDWNSGISHNNQELHHWAALKLSPDLAIAFKTDAKASWGCKSIWQSLYYLWILKQYVNH